MRAGLPFSDPVRADLERSLIARAFRSLPERWYAVLWHRDVEGTTLAEAGAPDGLR